MSHRSASLVLGISSFAFFMIGLAASGQPQVKPGDFIGPDNVSEVKELISPGVYYKVEKGMTMKIVASTRVDWPPPYKEATEKYSGQVRLTDDHRSMLGYVAGQPFPLVDANDRDVAVKIMWNNVFRPITSDDYDLRFFDCDSEYAARNAKFNALEYFSVGHYAGYQMVGRTEVEPLPFHPDFKKSGRFWLFALYPLLSPAEIHGTGFVRYRYAQPTKADDTWAYLPQSRRLRRLNESIMSSATAPGTSVHSWDPDHYAGFNAKTEEYNYRFLGEKEMLASVHAQNSPAKRCPTDGGASNCPEVWEMRHVYVVEATPRRELIHAMHSKTLIYMDSEMWFEPYIDTYDQKGQLYQNHIYWLTYRDRPVPDAKVAIYPFKRIFVVGGVSTDVQSGLSTMCYAPGIETPERECWYINMGAVEPEFFSTQSMVRAAH